MELENDVLRLLKVYFYISFNVGKHILELIKVNYLCKIVHSYNFLF